MPAAEAVELPQLNWPEPPDYFTEHECRLYRRAIALIEPHLRGRHRLTGESYAEHLIKVFETLVRYRLPAPVCIAGILHDALEDFEGVTSPVLWREFGPIIASYVLALTKDYTPVYYDQLLLAATLFPLVTFIKLADRLHNIQTVSGFDPAKQREYCFETLHQLKWLFRECRRYVPASYLAAYDELFGSNMSEARAAYHRLLAAHPLLGPHH